MSNPHFLEKHPTPWRLVARQRNWPSFQKEYIVDARGNKVLLAERSDPLGDTWFVGDVRGLVDFVNTVGMSSGSVSG